MPIPPATNFNSCRLGSGVREPVAFGVVELNSLFENDLHDVGVFIIIAGLGRRFATGDFIQNEVDFWGEPSPSASLHEFDAQDDGVFTVTVGLPLQLDDFLAGIDSKRQGPSCGSDESSPASPTVPSSGATASPGPLARVGPAVAMASAARSENQRLPIVQVGGRP
jgi:hypothetical protein